MVWRRARWDIEGWREAAACRDADPALFFAAGSTPTALEVTDTARRYCAGCSVAQECLIFAVTTNQEYGVWGGLDEDERRQVRRSWRRASRRAGAPAAAYLD
jgi:WhiB family redox-sensing transcriptional regulator